MNLPDKLTEMLTRLKAKAIGIGLALILFLCAVGALVFAAYLGLRMEFEPLWAALITAAGCLVLALIVLLLTRRSSRREHTYTRDDLEVALQESADHMVKDWIVRHPDRAAFAALALGLAAGSSRTVRKGLLSFLSGKGPQDSAPR